jgi:hypothetical protein
MFKEYHMRINDLSFSCIDSKIVKKYPILHEKIIDYKYRLYEYIVHNNHIYRRLT